MDDLNRLISGLSSKLARHIAQGPVDIVLAGGAAMAVYGLRGEVEDFDLYTPDVDVFKSWSRDKDPDLDITYHDNFWGQVVIGDALKRPVIFEDARVRVRCLDVASLFIMKTDAAREKDIDDLLLLGPMVEPMDILKRMAALRRYNPYGPWYLSTENLIAEIQLQYGLEITEEHIAATSVEPADKEVLMAAFGIAAQHKIKAGLA